MPDLTAKKKRPRWYNLSPLSLPLPGLVSIYHRISGALLFLGLVWFLYLLDLSLSSESGFARFRAEVGQPVAKLALLVLAWSYLHHFCAGIRYLFMDIDRGVGLAATRRSSYAVLAVSLALTVFVGVKLW